MDLTRQYIAEHIDLRAKLSVTHGLEWLADCEPIDTAIDDAWAKYIRAFSEEQDRQMTDRNPCKEFREAGNG